ncbi:hypothetical protein [uncultured Methanobrevibacter sp.]|nr:hypothetical protein [uncultured Methanobrevibacter sp.]
MKKPQRLTHQQSRLTEAGKVFAISIISSIKHDIIDEKQQTGHI